MENDLIDLREQYGVFRRYARNRGMQSETLVIPRRTGGLTAYFVNEDTAVTESEKNWDQVTLVAKEVGVLAKYSMSLGEDAVIDIGNDLAREIAYAFSLKEDDCGFNGDAGSSYGGIVGIRTKILGLSATRANIAGLQVASGNAFSEFELLDFHGVIARLPQYANTNRTAWFVHKSFYHNVMERLMFEAGGVTAAEIVAGSPQTRFLGYPVVFSQVMPAVEANDVVVAIFGDLSLGSAFGDRRQTTIATSPHVDFAKRQMTVLGTERFDIVNHDVGNADATAANRVPGPICALATAAS